ncbi:MAG: FAD-binding domain-containing protein [Cyanobacteria bacterium P01_G01_bin.54]
MNTPSDLILLWHRRDLRVSDHKGLHAAQAISPKIVGVFCFDPHILKRDDIAPARVAYMVGCLAALADRYRQLGSQLLFIQAAPAKGILQLAQALHAQHVFWTKDVEPYATERDRQVRTALEAAGVKVHNGWDQLLCEPGQVLTGAGTPYTVYGPFWKNWMRQAKLAPLPTPTRLVGLTAAEQDIAARAGCILLPTAAELGYTWDKGFPIEPGEAAAQSQLEQFCDRALLNYDTARNYPEQGGTSRLSAALKFGAIGIRTLWQASQDIAQVQRSDEARQNILTWQKELAWREFYQHVLFFFPELAAGSYREPFKDFPWDNNPAQFQAWCAGRTGYPIVDAAMRQLNETGWMHNRCRMIVASFLTKDLIIDWRWGERYFMQTLVDGDLSANNGGWQWSASSGMDPKPLRIFNPVRQAQKFDAEAQYLRAWLPELSSFETRELVTGNIAPLERQQCGYPEPIVEHAQQQRRFKALYQTAKTEAHH